MQLESSRFRHVRLQTLLFGFLALFGILPILLISGLGIARNSSFFEREQKIDLSRQAETLSEQFGMLLRSTERQLELVAAGMKSIPTGLSPAARERWLQGHLQGFVEGAGLDFFPYVVALGDTPRAYRPPSVPESIRQAALVATDEATQGRLSRYAFVPASGGAGAGPWVLVGQSVIVPEGPSRSRSYVLFAAVSVPLHSAGDEEIFLLDRATKTVLWSSGTQSELRERAVERSQEIRGALEMTGGFPVLEYDLAFGKETHRMIGQLSSLGETGWTALVQKRERAALASIGTMVRGAALTAAITVLLALVLGGLASRMLSQPIQALAESSHEIAAGRFDERVEATGLGAEFHELAESFNTMGEQVQDHVVRLRTAARDNRELFIGSVRALLRAVEAKEPYTRGHSERVASYSQTIARYLQQRQEFLDEIWLAGLLHDVGKIGIEDRVLNKGDVLTTDEFEEMKKHPVIGADIMSSIEALRPVLPAIRWHHERWGGNGYPDGLVGKEIPLMARIVAVADTFDAVTTQRVYQDPYTPKEACQIIDRLEGVNFDPQVVAAFHAAFDAGEIAVMPVSRRERPAERPIEEYQPLHS